MGLESKVIAEVNEILEDGYPNFVCGTLFVTCNEEEAKQVVENLEAYVVNCKVDVHGPIQGEYAFDFVPG
jgi:hypothetical protein